MMLFDEEPQKWHGLMFLLLGSELPLMKAMNDRLQGGGSVCWVRTRDGDVHPLEVACPPLRACQVRGDDGVPVRGGANASFVDRSIHRVFGELAGRTACSASDSSSD